MIDEEHAVMFGGLSPCYICFYIVHAKEITDGEYSDSEGIHCQ